MSLTPGAEGVAQAVIKCVEEAFETRNNTSLLLIGPRGCGKSIIVRSALERVSSEKLKVLSLNGLVHSGDDRQAFAALAMLLGVKRQQILNAAAPTILELCSAALSEGGRRGDAIVLVVDDFELFAMQPKQTLFYSVLNLASGTDVQLVLIGMTMRIDAPDLLEKRVRSRFSERVIVIPRPETVEEAEIVLRNQGYDTDMTTENRKTIEKQLKNDRVMGSILMRAKFDGKDLSRSSGYIEVPTVVEEVLCGLSTLEMALLISMRRLIIKKGPTGYKFAEVYREYVSMQEGDGFQSNRLTIDDGGPVAGGDIFPKSLALKAWTQLLDNEILEAGTGGSVLPSVSLDEIREAIEKHANLSTQLRQWGTTMLT